MRFKQSFGFAIDYAKEIAADLAVLADAEKCLAERWFKPADAASGGYAFGLADLLISDGDAAARFGLTSEDRACLADAMDLSAEQQHARGVPVVPDEVAQGGHWFRRGDEIWKRVAAATGWASDLLTEEGFRRARSKAKTDLARHRRNQRKYG